MAPATVTDSPRRPDVVVAAVTGAVGVAGLLALPLLAATDPAESARTPDVASAGWWAVLAVLVVQAVALAWARPAPRVAPLVVAAAPLLLVVPGAADAAGLVTLAVAVAVYRAAVGVPLARLRLVLPATVVLLAAATVAGGRGSGPAGAGPGLTALVAVGQATAAVALGLVPARVVAARRAVRDAQAGELRALEREHEAQVQAALARQRTAMARELHDIAAHHLSGIALMASAIDRQIGTDPEAARSGLHAVRDQSLVVLGDLRRLVGLLREGDDEEISALSIAAVPELVRAHGSGATLEVLAGADPPAAGVGPLAQLTGYRMVQEALSNARAHAPGAACRVTVDDRAPDALVLTVRNGAPDGTPAPVPSGGYGLRGMAERAALVGAELAHGPTPDGGWQVRLRIPRDRTGEDGGAG